MCISFIYITFFNNIIFQLTYVDLINISDFDIEIIEYNSIIITVYVVRCTISGEK